MHERFTDQSRRVFQLANREAEEATCEYINSEHILLGLIEEGTGIAFRVLVELGVDKFSIQKSLAEIVAQSPEVYLGGQTSNPRARNIVELAMQEARQLNSSDVGTEHLLLALLRERSGTAAQVLMFLGHPLEDIRRQLLYAIDEASQQQRSEPTIFATWTKWLRTRFACG